MVEKKLAVVGAAGRMGLALIRTIVQMDGVRLVAAIDQKGAAAIGTDAGVLAGLSETLGIHVSDDAPSSLMNADALIDFTTPTASVEYAEYAAQMRLVHVIGTTGCSDQDEAKLRAAARDTVIVKSGNMSVGVNLLALLVKKASHALDKDFDIEILEMHHKHKVDAPSGTALLLGEAAAQGRSVDLEALSVRMRGGHSGARKPGTIGFAAMRGGSVVGSHSVILAGEGERLELSHIAEDRAIFARGALKAAIWGFNKKPGYYTMADVLGFQGSA